MEYNENQATYIRKQQKSTKSKKSTENHKKDKDKKSSGYYSHQIKAHKNIYLHSLKFIETAPIN
jgi:hypothetical protein